MIVLQGSDGRGGILSVRHAQPAPALRSTARANRGGRITRASVPQTSVVLMGSAVVVFIRSIVNFEVTLRQWCSRVMRW